MSADVVVSLHGSVALFHLASPAAESWVEDNVSEDRSWFDRALVVEHRFVGDLASGMSEDGLAEEVQR